MFVDRRKSNRHALAGLVVVIFVLLGAFSIVVGVLVEQNHALRRQGVRIESIARNAETAAEGAKRVAEESQPCSPGDPPTKPSCQRAARTEGIITRAIDLVRQAIAAGLELHDLNTHRQHEDLRQRVSETPPTVPVERTPITAAPSTTMAPTTAPPAPATTTTAPRPPVTLPPLFEIRPTVPAEPPVTAPPACKERGKSGKCK